MLMLLSPAKKLDYDSTVRTELHTQPQFVPQAQTLIEILRTKGAGDIAAMMNLSDALVDLNMQRYAQWQPSFDLSNSRQAILAFNGDVYEGLEAASLSDAQLQWAQDHLAILSGLYGVLRPMDLMQPYRLEMGTKLQNPQGGTLYAYWGAQLAQYLNERLQSHAQPWILNLASEEYFKAVERKTLQAKVVQAVFQDEKNAVWKVISFHAKRARGLMARYVIENSIQDIAALKAFDHEGYRYAAEVSTDSKLVFRRKEGVR